MLNRSAQAVPPRSGSVDLLEAKGASAGDQRWGLVWQQLERGQIHDNDRPFASLFQALGEQISGTRRGLESILGPNAEHPSDCRDQANAQDHRPSAWCAAPTWLTQWALWAASALSNRADENHVVEVAEVPEAEGPLLHQRQIADDARDDAEHCEQPFLDAQGWQADRVRGEGARQRLHLRCSKPSATPPDAEGSASDTRASEPRSRCARKVA